MLGGNRYAEDKTTQWNSWSAGGRDKNNAYYVDGSEYGHWGIREGDEEYFHAGDIVYLDVSEFTQWENNDAVMYVNFSDVSKEQNNGQDINLSNADSRQYNPKIVDTKIEQHIYAYVVSKDDDEKDVLRFWRGNKNTLWNYSVKLDYDQYKKGNNCVKITGWDGEGSCYKGDYSFDYEKDTDGDGLTDYNEFVYGTDINCIDSDKDGLSDYEEVAIIGTNPNKIDTDDNGIPDGNEDADGDGIKNSEECQLDTSNCTVDSDGDKISDYDEIYVHHTNPLDIDTDGDGADDKWEIENGFDATSYNKNFNVIQEEQGDNTSVEMELTASGENISSFSIKIHKDDSVFINRLLPGYIGSAFDFKLDGEFESATLKYYFDESNLETENFNPVVYYYNEQSHLLEEVDTHWDGKSNYVTAKLSHFSTYLLLNKTKFEEVWEKEIKAPSVEGGGKTNLNIAFVVDLSGSMSGTKLSTTKTAIKSFINVLEEDDLASLISFTSSATVINNLTNNKEVLNNAVDSMHASGLTSIYKGLDKAVDVLVNNETNGYDMIILFTDGYDEPSTVYDTHYKNIVQKAVENDITIYTIGISTVDQNLLTKIANETGGNYYYASVISDLQDKIDDIKEETEDQKKDSNNDGISDYYTKLICNGTLRVGTGAVIPELICNYDDFQKNADYDKDGLLNGEEIKVVEKDGRVYLEVLSYPTESDSDNDGISDADERKKGTKPLVYDMSVSDIDHLFKNDIYVSSVFSNEYSNSLGLRFQLGLGNLITNFKLSYVNDYKKALLQYIEQYNAVTFEDAKLEIIKQMYNSNIKEVLVEIVNYELVLNDVAFELDGYAQAVSVAEKSAKKLVSLEKTLKSIKDYSKLAGFDDELCSAYSNIQVQLLEQKSLYKAAETAQEASKLEGNLAGKIGKYLNNMPPKVATAMKAVKAFSDFITYSMIAIDTGVDVLNTLDLYASLDAGLIQYVELDEYLESIILYSDNDELVTAAEDVRYALSDDFCRTVSEIGMVAGNISEGAFTAAYTAILAKSGPLGWAIYLGWSLGNLISNTGKIDEELLKVIAYGESSVSYTKYIKNRLTYDTSSYYERNDDVVYGLQILGQLRIIGEDKYAEIANQRSVIRKWIGELLGCSQSDIEEFCSENIEDVLRHCGNCDILVNKKFTGSYLN